jgi:hypothetical protein
MPPVPPNFADLRFAAHPWVKQEIQKLRDAMRPLRLVMDFGIDEIKPQLKDLPIHLIKNPSMSANKAR